MAVLADLIRTADELVRAPTVVVADAILRTLALNFQQRGNDSESLNNFLNRVTVQYHRADCALAACEGWEWLHHAGLLCQHPIDGHGWFTLTRKGREVAGSASSLPQWIAGREMPDDILHDSLQGQCLNLFRQGMWDTAVFEAFKSLEINIRSAAGLGDDLLGTRLAARAFHPKDGELTDLDAEEGERQALMNLMTGALGSYKNPQSHRHVGLQAPEAREMIIMASHLLRIVDSRRKDD